MSKHPAEGRAIIHDDADALRVIIPYHAPGEMRGVAILMLAAAIAMMLFAARGFGPPGDLFMYFWYGGILFWAALVLRFLLWKTLGRELWTVSADRFLVERRLGALGFAREYFPNLIHRVRVAAEEPVSQSPGRRYYDFWNIHGGTIKLDHGRQTVQLGNGLDEADARYVCSVLKARGWIPADEFLL